MSSSWRVLALVSLISLLLPVECVITFRPEPSTPTDLIALHQGVTAGRNAVVQIKLKGYSSIGAAYTAYITSLPAVGSLYQTSHNFRVFGYLPAEDSTPLTAADLPALVGDPNNIVVYKPPADVFPPTSQWATFKFAVDDGVKRSAEATVTIANPDLVVQSSNFLAGSESWTVAGNLYSSDVSYEVWSWGQLNRYVHAEDDNIYIDPSSGFDNNKWYFVAPSKFALSVPMLYNGTLSFWFASSAGNFSQLNSPLDFVSLECSSCKNGRGLRVVRFLDNSLTYTGGFKQFSLSLIETAGWLKDPGSKALPFTAVTQCEMVALLSNLSGIKILGDLTTFKESIALDAVTLKMGNGVPLACNNGCTCAYDALLVKPSCC